MGHYMGVGSTSNISCATREVCFNSFDLAQTILSVLHKELESKVEKEGTRRLEGMQPRIKNKSKPRVGE